ncbi:MAG: DUF3343 domain-containing protein [Candidatus Cloacimonetes bacterium]|nr:DUF3343 domain-containing protein [Candidatus Cloacimonadota bacterium]
MKGVVLFHSTNHAIWAENELKNYKIACKMISVPRYLSSDCGYCIQINADDKEKVIIILNKNNIEFEKIETL